jgi:hypothetical protein
MPRDGVPSNENEIVAFQHCAKCLAELPPGTSPREWARFEFGWTMRGLQVWCVRHECNVLHIDFEGHKHPANATAKVDKDAPAVAAERARWYDGRDER